MTVTLGTIAEAERRLTQRFQQKLAVNPDLDRTLVSFRANKQLPGFRWCKYKEGFSAQLVEYVLDRLNVRGGRLLDPFAGAGTALLVAGKRGMSATGIELLPVGCEIIEARKRAFNGSRAGVRKAVRRWIKERPWTTAPAEVRFAHFRITQGAFPAENEEALVRYLSAADDEPAPLRRLLRFAAMCVLEDISYTRKDGQYLRWDARCGLRHRARPFHKGPILAFHDAILNKLCQIDEDLGGEPLAHFSRTVAPGQVEVVPGSCLEQLPRLGASSFDCLITSPPYCNRYDYTRTYALELALLGTTEERLRQLRQTMISCTVENKAKEGLQAQFGEQQFARGKAAFDRQELLQQVLAYLDDRKAQNLLNNTGIPRMVRNYFWEMALVIFECARVLKPAAPLVMVNDNVRYEGARIAVDLVLSDIAEQAGFTVETIWVLPVGKGNSSQQMGKHGRAELRKCVYVWRAPEARPAAPNAASVGTLPVNPPLRPGPAARRRRPSGLSAL